MERIFLFKIRQILNSSRGRRLGSFDVHYHDTVVTCATPKLWRRRLGIYISKLVVCLSVEIMVVTLGQSGEHLKVLGSLLAFSNVDCHKKPKVDDGFNEVKYTCTA